MDVFLRGQVKSTQNPRACNKRLMAVDESKEIYQGDSKWKKVGSFYLNVPLGLAFYCVATSVTYGGT